MQHQNHCNVYTFNLISIHSQFQNPFPFYAILHFPSIHPLIHSPPSSLPLLFRTNTPKRLHIHLLHLLSSTTRGKQLASNLRRDLMMEVLLQHRLQHLLLLARQLRLVSLHERQQRLYRQFPPLSTCCHSTGSSRSSESNMRK